MANQSALHQMAVNVRAAGSKDQTTGLVLGGIYFPEHIKADGTRVSARWEGQFFVNQLGYTDSEGAFHEPKNVPIRITAWNGKNATTGKGLADTFAKCVSVGKELCAVLRMDYFQKRLFIQGVAQTDHLGQPIKVGSYGWLIKSDLQWGADSALVIANEISNWQGQANFSSRPPMWNVQGHADNEAWKTVVANRMATIFQGEGTYGYARVMVPEGATIVNAAGQPISSAQPQQSSIIPPPPGQQTQSGPTYQQMLAAGWTDALLQANNYGHLIPAAGSTIPAPPINGQLPTNASTGMGGTPLTNSTPI